MTGPARLGGRSSTLPDPGSNFMLGTVVTVPSSTSASVMLDGATASVLAVVVGAIAYGLAPNTRVMGVRLGRQFYVTDIVPAIVPTPSTSLGTWTPTLSASGGGTLTAGTCLGEYSEHAGIVQYHVSLVITTLGTGTGTLRFTLPPGFNIHANWSYIGGYRDSSTGPSGAIMRSGATTADLLRYDNAGVLASARSFQGSGAYRWV